MKKEIPADRQPQRGDIEPETPAGPRSGKGKWLGIGALLALLAGLGLGAWGYQSQHK
jgi:hypothetical protein